MAMTTKHTTKKQLVQLRVALLQLHQKLLDYQRRHYEKAHGRVQSTGKMFTLASSNKEFAWLRSLSELIVSLDSYIDASEFDSKNIRSLFKYTKNILTPSAKKGPFETLYFEAIQNDPIVLISHRKVIAALENKTPISVTLKIKLRKKLK
ncbi:MAG: hypothetical protein M3Q64_03215 [bacterium]|nr:hypothetical protein [bacterium]